TASFGCAGSAGAFQALGKLVEQLAVVAVALDEGAGLVDADAGLLGKVPHLVVFVTSDAAAIAHVGLALVVGHREISSHCCLRDNESPPGRFLANPTAP